MLGLTPRFLLTFQAILRQQKFPAPVLSVDLEEYLCRLVPICTSERQDGTMSALQRRALDKHLQQTTHISQEWLLMLRLSRAAAACTVSPVLPVVSSSRKGMLYTWQ